MKFRIFFTTTSLRPRNKKEDDKDVIVNSVIHEVDPKSNNNQIQPKQVFVRHEDIEILSFIDNIINLN